MNRRGRGGLEGHTAHQVPCPERRPPRRPPFIRGYARPSMRVLVVTNMTPDESYPGRGIFVRDQVAALRELGVEIELYSFPVGSSAYLPATLEIRRRLRRQPFDLVHAHYGLAAWCAKLAGAKPLVVTFHGTDVRHRVTGRLSRRLVDRVEIAGAASRALFAAEGGIPGLPHAPGRSAVIPCGADLDRFVPADRGEARARLGLDPDGRYLLFPASPERRVKRFDRAKQVADLAGAELLYGGRIEVTTMPDWINASNAVLVPSDNEGFGLVAIEALACDVTVLSTPVGVAPTLLAGVDGCLVERFDARRWAEVARRALEVPDGRIEGRRRAEWFSAELLAGRVLTVYRQVLATADLA
ncbi:MAG: glycosyltransferase [Solirubrobacterales bacterium]